MGTKSNRSAGTQHTPRGITQGNILVCPHTGNPIDSVVDNEGVTRLAVDSSVTIDAPTIEIDLDPTSDGVHIGDQVTGDLLVVNPDGSINVNTEVDASDGDSIAISAHPNQIFDEGGDTITTAIFEEIYSYTSVDNDTRIINVDVSLGTPSLVRLKINGVTKRELRSSPQQRNVEFVFKEHRPLNNGDVLTVEAKVGRLIQTSYSTFTSLEGYLV